LEEEVRSRRLLTIIAVACLVLVLAVLSFMAACAEEASPAPPAPAAPTPVPPPKAPEVIQLNYAWHGPPSVNPVLGFDFQELWCQELTKRTGGRVEATYFPGEALCKTADSLDALEADIAQVVSYAVPAIPGRFPIAELVTDTPLCMGNMRVESEVLDRLLYAGLLKEYEGYKPVFWYTFAPNMLFMTDKKVTKADGLKGLKIRVRGATATKLVEALGGTPVAIETAELYMSLERGIIDGVTTNIAAYMKLKLHEVTKYGIDHTLYGGLVNVIMKESFWNSLPPDIQVIMLELNNEIRYIRYDDSDTFVREGYKMAATGGREIYKLAPAEWAKWKEALAPLADDLAAELDAKGLPGSEVTKIAREVLAAYGL
jgi:TRAP-type C4-dicarboxylate transport system substrate-binding protein